MSHTVTIKAACTDAAVLRKACADIGAEFLGHRTTKMYSSSAKGLAVHLAGWNYPVTFDTETGAVKFDNYGGSWGDMKELDRLIQAYGIEKVKQEAYLHGLTFAENDEVELENGDIQLTLHYHVD